MLQGNTSKEKAASDRKLEEEEKKAGKNETDTAPDEFIAPNADTDVPLDHEGIVNDAVLRGEDHENDKADNKQNTGK